ncbi:ABC-type transport auxiliary lipoprotein family protein [Phenylobacterium sp.]|uniref:ABC-type transport auxiliary lipoprotein family protein n=1 Tax=Phenylobacterium sp. TaxID=1871053 RepID=UPI002DE9628D|nr:ABC-type transport auxiliary lipoprotein family protein [Phenylobacterium sp.]
MTPLKALLRLAGAGLLALSLAGCISLLPKTKPAQLYRFGVPAAAAKAAPGAAAIGVFSGGGEFQQESVGDRILTVTGDRAAYVAEARWAAPAEVMFNQAVANAFETSDGHVRLVPRGAPAPTDYVLRLDVRNFEARYDSDGGVPTVVVRAHATLTRDRSRSLVAEQVFESRVRAGDNRVTAIVAAFDHAVGDVLGQLVAWTNASAR